MAFYDDDINEFFSGDDFAINVVVDPDGTPTLIQALFDNDYLAQDTGYGADLATRQPRLTVKTVDADSFIAQSTILKIGGIRYTVDNIESDGTGISEVPLSKV